MDKILEEMMEYICDKRCRYPNEVDQEELDEICDQCAMNGYVSMLEAMAAGQSNEEIHAYRAIGTVDDLKTMKENGAFTGVELAQMLAMQMELKKYQSIGTAEELQALKKKAEPKEPIVIEENFNENNERIMIEWKCSVCGLNVIEEPPCQNYCQQCGNRLNWQGKE